MRLPLADGGFEDYRLTGLALEPAKPTAPFNRVAIAAAHVVADPLSAGEPSLGAALDWERTLAYRRYLLDQGFGIAEAMDTAQRGMGLDWPSALDLIRHSLAAAEPHERSRIVSGCGTDQLAPGAAASLDDVVRVYLDQLHAIQKLGGRVIVMASRALARLARGPHDYASVYGRVLAEAEQPVILHWLGDMFDPRLAGYWGATEFAPQLDACLAVIADHAVKIDGIKISLLDDAKEIALRRRLPQAVKMYTGDDFNYPTLIAGDGLGHSHALLGIFDAIAPAASQALGCLARGDLEAYHGLLEPTVALARLIFRAPTRFYKTGIVFLAWLNGFQDHFIMVGGQQSMRPLGYFAEAFRLADRARLLSDPERAVRRMGQLLSLHGAA